MSNISSSSACNDDTNDGGSEDGSETCEVPNFHSTAEQPSATVLGAQFILKTRDGKKLTQVATDGIIADTKVMLQSTLKNLEKSIIQRIGPTMTDVQIEEVRSVFSDKSIVNPFHGLDTQYQQQSFIQQNFNYVVCP